MKKNTLANLKATFNKELNRIKEQTKETTNHYIQDLSLNTLSREKQAEKLHSQMQSIRDDYEDSDYKEYFLLSQAEDIIFTLFFSRFILAKQNDLAKIEKALLLVSKYKRIRDIKMSMMPRLKELLSNKAPINFYAPNTPQEYFYKKEESQLYNTLKEVQRLTFLMKTDSKTFSYINIEAYNISCAKFSRWKKNPKPIFKTINFNMLFNDEFSYQINYCKKLIKKFNKQSFKISTIENRLQSLQNIFDTTQCPVISNIEDNKHHLKAMFFSYILANDDVHYCLAILRLSIIISSLSDYYIKEYSKQSEDICSYPQTLKLLARMGTESELYNDLAIDINNIIKERRINEKPVFSTYENTRKRLTNTFMESAERLEDYYENIDIDSAIFHAITENHTLSIYENKLSRKNIKITPLTKELESIFHTEISHIKTVYSLNNICIDIPFPDNNTKIAQKKSSRISFGYNQIDVKILRDIICSLNLNIDLLKQETSTEDLINILTSKDLTKITNKIFLNCKTNEFRYIIEQLKYLFNNLSFALIAESKLFYSKKNLLITRSNLSNSKTDLLQRKNQINKTFLHLHN